MAAQAQGPIGPPGEQQDGQQFDAMGGGTPTPSPAPAQPDPNAMALQWIKDIVTTTRRLGAKFPQAAAEVREINNIVTRIVQKMQGAGPQPQSQAPPI